MTEIKRLKLAQLQLIVGFSNPSSLMTSWKQVYTALLSARFMG